jgi:hypothetical protein
LHGSLRPSGRSPGECTWRNPLVCWPQ